MGGPFKDSETANHPNRVFFAFYRTIGLLPLDNRFKGE